MNGLADVRKTMTTQYAGWLKDLDEKCRITVMIATLIIALAGAQLAQQREAGHPEVLALALLLSLLALIYGIRGYTSRHTSGHRAGGAVQTAAKQWIGYFLDWPKSWQNIPGDELAKFNELKGQTPEQQASAHIEFFTSIYGTAQPEAIENLRLYELKAANYSKVYCERLASKLLILAVVVVCIWVFLSSFSGHSKTGGAPDRAKLIDEQLLLLQNKQQSSTGQIDHLTELSLQQAVSLEALKGLIANLDQQLAELRKPLSEQRHRKKKSR